MARRPTGPKAPARESAIADALLAAGTTGTAVPGHSAGTAAPGRSAGTAAAEPSAQDEAGSAAAPRLVALRVAAAAQALEAGGLAVAAVFAAISTADGRSYQLTGGVAATVIAIATAAGLAGLATCLALGKPWTRIPTALTQLFVIIAGVTLLQGHRPEWGVPALALAAACLAGLATPASLRALNRPPVKDGAPRNPQVRKAP
jgi:hypothetical protein